MSYLDIKNFKYPSDWSRALLIKELIESPNKDQIAKSNSSIKTELLSKAQSSEDLIACAISKDRRTIYYVELWASSCWDGLFTKPEYKTFKKRGITNKEGAIKKFIDTRFKDIANRFNFVIKNYQFEEEESYEGIFDSYDFIEENDPDDVLFVTLIKK